MCCCVEGDGKTNGDDNKEKEVTTNVAAAYPYNPYYAGYPYPGYPPYGYLPHAIPPQPAKEKEADDKKDDAEDEDEDVDLNVNKGESQSGVPKEVEATVNVQETNQKQAVVENNNGEVSKDAISEPLQKKNDTEGIFQF